MSEKTYEVIFGDIHSALPTHDGWYCKCDVRSGGTSIWECRFAIDRGTLRKWQFNDSDIASVLSTCGLDETWS
jgi:hypothetical protein